MIETEFHIIETKCSHCGEPCETTNEQDLNFCCEGCKTVYHILHDNGLCSYYEFVENPGITIQSGIERKRFDYLIDQEVQDKLINFKNSDSATASFYIPNIHCTSCVWLLENLQNLDEGILQGTVNFLKRSLTIVFDTKKTSLRNIVELLTTIGYEPDLKLEHLSEQKSAPIQRSLWLKLGVAGFSFGNIMLFSFPEYLSMSVSDSVEEFKIFFGALNILLAIPVLVYSSSDYLKSAWAAISQKGINLDVPISMGIIALFGRSLYEILSGTGAGYFDSFTGFIFFLLIGKIVQKKTFDGLSFDRDYKSYLPISVIRLKNNIEESVSVKKIEIGDHIIIRNNELIPSDSILESDFALIDYSFITGESNPVTKKKGDFIYAGGKITGAQAQMMITKKVQHSYLTQLWENESLTAKDENKVSGFADRISPYFTFTVVVIAIVSCIVWLQIEPTKAFTIFTAVLIVACPCALALSTPFTFGSATNILSLNGLYLKNTDSVEQLASINSVVFDKTGTITDSEKSQIEYHGSDLTENEKVFLKATARNSTHPYSKKIYELLKKEVPQNILLDSIEEVRGKGMHASYKGSNLLMGSQIYIEEYADVKIKNSETLDSLVHIYIGNEYKGYYSFDNKIRNGLPEIIAKLKVKYPIRLLSGDNKKDGNKLQELFGGWQNMHFNQTPQQKLEFVDQLSSQNEKVLMIGDGLNDAGALKASYFGISISDKTSSFSPACDGILDSEKLNQFDKLLEFSNDSVKIIIASFILSLLYNLTGLGFAVTGHLSPLVAAILMPLSSVSVMVFTTVLTRVKAKKLGLNIWA